MVARPEGLASPPFDQELPPPGSFRPCRSSRLRRLSPLVHRRPVSSCSRPWGSPRFRPVPPSPGVPASVTWSLLRVASPVLPWWLAASACLLWVDPWTLPSVHHGCPVFPVAFYPSKVFPRPQPSLASWVLPGRCTPRRELSTRFFLSASPFLLAVGALAFPWPPGRCAASPEGCALHRLAPWFPPLPSASRPCSASESVAGAGVSAFACPILPWAWFLLLFQVGRAVSLSMLAPKSRRSRSGVRRLPGALRSFASRPTSRASRRSLRGSAPRCVCPLTGVLGDAQLRLAGRMAREGAAPLQPHGRARNLWRPTEVVRRGGRARRGHRLECPKAARGVPSPARRAATEVGTSVRAVSTVRLGASGSVDPAPPKWGLFRILCRLPGTLRRFRALPVRAWPVRAVCSGSVTLRRTGGLRRASAFRCVGPAGKVFVHVKERPKTVPA